LCGLKVDASLHCGVVWCGFGFGYGLAMAWLGLAWLAARIF